MELVDHALDGRVLRSKSRDFKVGCENPGGISRREILNGKIGM